MTRPQVRLDVDGVICDFLGPALETINELTGQNARLDQMTTWHLFDAFTFDVPKKIQEACYDVWKAPGWCRALPVYPDAVLGVERLREIADVIIVTSPMNGDTWCNERERWLMKHFGFTRDQIIHTNAKWTVSGDFLVDDKTSHCVAWKASHPDGVAVRWDQVTNRHDRYTQGPTVYGWSDLIHHVSNYEHREHRRWRHQST